MGCDGGTIPRRIEMVKLKKKAEKVDKDSELAAKWKHCALSGEHLKKPIVACDLGKMYNKECLLLALLDKQNLPEVAKHVRSLKDVVELQLTPNLAYTSAAKAMTGVKQPAEYVCPISGLEMSGRHRFVFLRGCGCVLSEKVLKEVPSQKCHKCGHDYSRDEVVVLNGTEDEMTRQREAMDGRRLDAKQAKLAKRKRKNEISSSSPEQPVVTASSSSSSSEEGGSPPVEKKLKISTDKEDTAEMPLTNGSTTDDKEVSKTSRIELKSVASSKSTTSLMGASRYSRQRVLEVASEVGRGGSCLGLGSAAASIVQKTRDELASSFKPAGADLNARGAYKSLFHSADKERPKDKQSHWVTFFPYH